ncbi:hypothetical protein AB0B89_16265 [Sphaerisporangium sp. NPDC049002]
MSAFGGRKPGRPRESAGEYSMATWVPDSLWVASTTRTPAPAPSSRTSV